MSLRDFKYEGGDFVITDEMKNAYKEDGYILVRGLFSTEEVAHIEKAIIEGPILNHSYGVDDGEGKKAHMVLWNHPGNDVTGMVGRCEKVAGSCEKLLGGEVYHYHTKLMKKPAKVLKSSHKCGRIDHVRVGNQVGADVSRVDEISKVCPLQFVEMVAGDALFFDCNLLHCSSANMSEARRWAFLCAYNKADNNPTKEHHHPRYTPLQKVPDSAVVECQEFKDMSGKSFNSITKETKSLEEVKQQEVKDGAILECKEIHDMTEKWFHKLGDETNCEKSKTEEDK
ncbi:hypothetical protein MAR_032924 [Mya arenaria]|uniref:Phytanoyl-CoA dioxygenase n=1 Tax=Mya arenaria TaxID=6604 RepID=A0ABY7G7I3_MYAAR|nr:hypothetical protein MAR_032924 [Mya arenaria]